MCAGGGSVIQVFPVFRVRLGAANVQLYNGPVLALLACALVGMFWGILFVVFATPPYIGTIGICVSEVAGVLIVLEIRAHAHDGFNDACATLSAVARRQAPASGADGRHPRTLERRVSVGTSPPTAADIARDTILLDVVRRAATVMEAPGHAASDMQVAALTAVVADGSGSAVPEVAERPWEDPYQSTNLRRTVLMVKQDVTAMLLGRFKAPAFGQTAYADTTGACLGMPKDFWAAAAVWEHAHARLGVDVVHRAAGGDAPRLHAACVLLLQVRPPPPHSTNAYAN